LLTLLLSISGLLVQPAAAQKHDHDLNPLQVALLKWAPNLTTTFTVGGGPEGVAFDGTNIWVANEFDNTVTKLQASDGAFLGTFTVGSFPYGVAFDGTNFWVANFGDGTVTKLRASDGALLGIFAAGNGPNFIAFDGANVWITNVYVFGNGTLTKLRA